MRNAQATKFTQEYFKLIEKTANIKSAAESFNISPVVETKLRESVLEAAQFLSMISVLPVDQIKGQVVDVGGGALFTGRVKDGRFRKQIGNSGNIYELTETDSCASISWSLLSQWANIGTSKEFIKKMNAAISKHFALDIIRVGFHGKSISETTDPEKNPNGEDVNKGWLTIVKEKAPLQVIERAILDSTGATDGSHSNLDSMANDLRNSLIAEAHVEDADLVVCVGRNLITAEQSRLMAAADKPSEHNAAQKLDKTIAGMKSYIPASFPPNMLWVTSLSNLQVLQQKGTQWRSVKNVDDRKAIENSWLRNEGYAISNFKKFAAIEDVIIVGAATSALDDEENNDTKTEDAS